MAALLESVLVVTFLSYFFYRNALAAIPLSLVGIWFFNDLKKRNAEKKRRNLELEFRECILSVVCALKAGYAVENAFIESVSDMRQLYGEKSLMIPELNIIKRGLVVNIPLEELLRNFAERSGSERIRQFGEIFSIAKKNGGDMPEIIKVSAELIGKEINTRAEIRTILSGKRLEQNIMKLMPFAIIIYIGISSKGYFDPLYGNIKGVLIMTVCLAVYLLAYYKGEKILNRMEKEA